MQLEDWDLIEHNRVWFDRSVLFASLKKHLNLWWIDNSWYLCRLTSIHSVNIHKTIRKFENKNPLLNVIFHGPKWLIKIHSKCTLLWHDEHETWDFGAMDNSALFIFTFDNEAFHWIARVSFFFSQSIVLYSTQLTHNIYSFRKQTTFLQCWWWRSKFQMSLT